MIIAEHLQQCIRKKWLSNLDNQELSLEIERNLKNLSQLITISETKPKVLIVERDSIRFIAAFFACLISNVDLFLCNPNWQQDEWRQVFELVRPHFIFGKNNINLNISNISRRDLEQDIFLEDRSLIMIPTGGTSGKIKFAMHTLSTLTSSVNGFCSYFELEIVNSFCILPLYHVSGLMQLMRSFVTQGKFFVLPYKILKQHLTTEIDTQNYFISLVPTQLRFLIELSPKWLAGFYTILLGGSAASQSFLNRARNYRIPLAPTYGMTETASQVVTLNPKDFLEGNKSIGRVLPHVNISITKDGKEILLSNTIGLIELKCNSLCLGYYPERFKQPKFFTTDDLGYFDRKGYLYIVGRNNYKIISGGENIFPIEVENAILATNLVKDVCVVGIPDPYWEEAVAALYIPLRHDINVKNIKQQLQLKLSKYKQPKIWILVDELPRCDRGKLNYQKLMVIAQNWIKNKKSIK